MTDYSASTYGDQLAEVYDEWFGDYEDASIDELAQLAGSGRVLELGIGTGRLAIPLAARGISIHGIDASEAMISKLRAREGGESIAVTMGNFADVSVQGEFSLVYIVFNTFYALATQEEQVRCFENVAAHLKKGGTFVIEGFVPDMSRFSGGQEVRARIVTLERVNLQVSQHDPVSQLVTSQFVVFSDNQLRLFPVQIRYCWPSELDLMAQLAGMRLRHRWSGWSREAFTASSEKHISVYELVG